MIDRVEVRLGAGFDRGTGGGAYRAATAGGGVKLDLAASERLVVSASAEGLAVLSGRFMPGAAGHAAAFGLSGGAEVRLGADPRINNNWRAFAGLGLR